MLAKPQTELHTFNNRFANTVWLKSQLFFMLGIIDVGNNCILAHAREVH